MKRDKTFILEHKSLFKLACLGDKVKWIKFWGSFS